MARVVLQGVSRFFSDEAAAVRQIDLEVRDREFLVLVGPSGCGKSTTLRMIAGLEEPDEGEIYIGDRAVSGVPPKDRDVAMVFQNYALYPHMNVYQNMAFGLQLRYGSGLLRRLFWRLVRPAWAAELWRRQEMIDRRVRETAKSLGLDGLLERMPADLSGGERQRVALGRAIVREPAVFLFDEPLSNLDAKLRVEMRREIKQLHRRLQTTMVYVTHDQVEAMTLGERVAVMQDGQLQQVATPLELYRRPLNRFVAGFLGSPPMNFVEGELIETDGSFVFRSEGFTTPVDRMVVERVKPYAGRRLTLGVRPEHLRLVRPLVPTQEGVCPANVDAVEPLGDAVVVHLSVGAESRQAGAKVGLIAKGPADVPVRIGEPCGIAIESRDVHFFDPQSGKNVSLPGSV